jgi:hypothetical protein
MSTTSRSVARSPRSFTSATRSRARAPGGRGRHAEGCGHPRQGAIELEGEDRAEDRDDLFGFGISVPWTGPAMLLSPALMEM